MQNSALLVAHGQPSDPALGAAEMARLRARVAAHLPGVALHGVTLAEPGALEALAAKLPEGTPLYPMFMADGWFTTRELPRRLGGAPLRLLPPFGTDPALPAFGAELLGRVLAQTGWRADQTALIVAGHGSGRSARPAEVTHEFAQALQARMGFAALSTGFVEEAPSLTEALAGHDWRAICLPFFATRRGHVLEDLPEAVAEVGYRGLVLDPIGTHAATPAFIARQIRAALSPSAPAAQA